MTNSPFSRIATSVLAAGTLALAAAPARSAPPDPLPASEPAPVVVPAPAPEAGPALERAEPTPVVSPTPVAVPAPVLAPVTAVTHLAAPDDPTPRRGQLELAVTTELAWLVADSAQVIAADGTTTTPQIRVGWSPLDALDVYVGWRLFAEVGRGDKGYDLTTSGDAVVAGARGRVSLLPWLAAVGELDVEALHIDQTIAVGERRASTAGWTFGAVPKLGLEATLDLGGWLGVLRVEGGYALRAPLAVDDVRFQSDAAETVPVDLGTLDLSGPVFAATLAVRF